MTQTRITFKAVKIKTEIETTISSRRPRKGLAGKIYGKSGRKGNAIYSMHRFT